MSRPRDAVPVNLSTDTALDDILVITEEIVEQCRAMWCVVLEPGMAKGFKSTSRSILGS